MICKICSWDSCDKHLINFAIHLRETHDLSSFQYTLEFLHGGVRPKCVCGSDTRFVSFSFKSLCAECARSVGGRKGGEEAGKTKRGEQAPKTTVLKDLSHLPKMSCLVCGACVDGAKRLSNHVMKEHRLDSEEYTIRHILKLPKRPDCASIGCSEPVRYVAFSFKKYCKYHKALAESEGGKLGAELTNGLPKWNKGKTKADDPRIAAYSERYSGAGNPFFGKSHSEETKEQISSQKRLSPEDVQVRMSGSSSFQYFEMVSSLSEYKKQGFNNNDVSPYLKFRCRTCGDVAERTFLDIQRGTRCHACFPIGSIAESEVADFVRGHGLKVEQNTRRVIPPKELDIWVPDKNVGIEYHGLFWHSGGRSTNEEEPYSRTLHREKYDLALAKGIHLIQFFADEWRDQRTICESMILGRLGINQTRLNARDCEPVELSTTEGRAFLDSTHIDGGVRSAAFFGLKHPEHGLVHVISVRTPVQKKHGNLLEISRLASALNTIVRGGASKLISNLVVPYAKDRGFEGLLSYSDNRFGSGGLYAQVGFELLGETSINYWYVSPDNKYRENRFKYRAQPGKPEVQVAQEAGVRAIHGAGNKIWRLRF